MIAGAARTFDSRLEILENLLRAGEQHLKEDEAAYLARRLAPDMLPLGTQVAYTCNQPRNFVLWLQGRPNDNLAAEVSSMDTALRYIADTRTLLAGHLESRAALPERMHLTVGAGLSAKLTGQEYLNDFLMPNLYFHLVTAYGILRNAGVPIGKKDYMLYLLPKFQQEPP
jgi:uncharacterized protein